MISSGIYRYLQSLEEQKSHSKLLQLRTSLQKNFLCNGNTLHRSEVPFWHYLESLETEFWPAICSRGRR